MSKITLFKRDASDDDIIAGVAVELAEYADAIRADTGIDQAAVMAKCLRSCGDYLKANLQAPITAEQLATLAKAADWGTQDRTALGSDGEAAINDRSGASVTPDKLERYAVAVMTAAPGLRREEAYAWLLHDRVGRDVARHLAGVTKRKEQSPMPQIDIYKLNNTLSIVEIAKHADISEHEFSEMLMGHARLHKRDNESAGAALERILCAPTPEGVALRKAYAKVNARSFPNSMRVTPVSTEIGDTREDGESDANKAAAQIAELVAEQRKLAPTLTVSRAFELVYADAANKSVVARAHKRPDASSPGIAALEGEGKW